MKKIGIILLCLACAVQLRGQTVKVVESRITEATVFLNRAQVTRIVTTRVEAGKTELVITGLTSQLDPESVQLAARGNFVILGVRHQQNYLTELNTPRALKVLNDSLDWIQKKLAIEQSQKEILNKEEQLLLSNQKIGGTNQNLTVAELKAMADFYRSRLTELVTARISHEEAIKRWNERLSKLQHQVREETDLYSRNTSELIVSIDAANATTVGMEVQYLVGNAGWSAVYDLRATNTQSPIQLGYKANVFQRTGEDWKNVKLKLSTANPSLGGVKPELASWYLDFSQPLYYRKEKKVAYRSSSAPATADISYEKAQDLESADAESLAAYTSVIQTTLNTEFTIALPYTVLSSSKPTLVDIAQHELKSNYRYAVAPKLETDAFLIAKVYGWEEFSLLPGEANVFFEGTFVSKTQIDPNNIKDTLNVSLGRDKRIVVKREKLKEFSSRKLIGANQRDSYAFEISVRNTKNEPIKITIEDQIPVSRNSQIEVAPIDLGNGSHDVNTGKIIWDQNIKPGETKKVVFRFEVKYPKDKIIPLL